MAETHVISALTTKRAELRGDIIHYKEMLKIADQQLSTIDQTIKIFSPDYTFGNTKPINKHRNRYFEPGEATKTLLDILRASKKPLLLDNIISEAVMRKNLILNESEIRAVTKSLSTTLNSLIKKGLVFKDITGDNSKALWNIAEV